MKQLHPIQLKILQKLLFAETLRYSDLKPRRDMENNQFNFHLDQLIKGNYVKKQIKNYTLTNFGKEYANRMSTKKLAVIQQSKISVWVCCTKQKNGNLRYLIHTRLKQPFYGCQGFITGKVEYGERIIEAAKRVLQEKTKLEGTPQLVKIDHYLVFDRGTEELEEDQFMFLCLVENPQGRLIGGARGEYQWVNEKDLRSFVTNHFENFAAFQKQIKEIKNFRGQITLEEIDHKTSKF